MKKILVTGGAGVIGSHLCLRLLEDGNQVVCLDNFMSANRNGITSLEGNPSFDVVRHDVTIPFNINVDQIYHLASPSSPSFFRQNPTQTMKSVIFGTMNALDLARRLGCPIVVCSSADVYGYSRLPIESESSWGNVNTIGARSAIEEGKRAAESLCKAFSAQHRVKAKIARLFNTYGPNGSIADPRVLPKFIVNAIRGNDITIYGTGQQTRCFCFATDMVEALIRLMNATPDTFINPVNLGSHHEISIIDLAEKIVLMTGSKSKIVHLNNVYDDPRHKTPDISRARQILAWEPSTSLDHGLKSTIDYFVEIIENGIKQSSNHLWTEMA